MELLIRNGLIKLEFIKIKIVMKTEEIIFTEEMFKVLFNKVDAICKAVHGIGIDYVKVTDDTIYGVEEDRYSNDWDSYEITIEELNNSDLDALIAEHLEKERIRREKEAAERIERERLNKLRQEEVEFKTYQKLKAKFEGK